MKKFITILNPLFWLFGKHICKYDKLVYDIPMENDTNYLITQCKCGKTDLSRVHKESEYYKNLYN